MCRTIGEKENPLAQASGFSRDKWGYSRKRSIRLDENSVWLNRGPLLLLQRVRSNRRETEIEVFLFKLPLAQSHPMLPREALDGNLRFQAQDRRDDDPSDVMLLDHILEVSLRPEHLVAIHPPRC